MIIIKSQNKKEGILRQNNDDQTSTNATEIIKNLDYHKTGLISG